MSADTWSSSEKRLARQLFEAAAVAEEAELVQEFKAKAAAAENLDQVWELRRYLETSEREYRAKYDFRYSQLLFVFARLVREGRLNRDQLNSLSEPKLAVIDRVLSL